MMEELFDFSEALRKLKNGHKVKRKDWGGYWFLVYDICINPGTRSEDMMEDMIVACLKDSNAKVPAQPYQVDLLAEDWMVYTK